MHTSNSSIVVRNTFRKSWHPASCDIDDLVDLRDVTIDRSLPLRERFLDYVAQVKNPYLYKVGPIIVKLDKGGNIRFSDALTRGLLNS